MIKEYKYQLEWPDYYSMFELKCDCCKKWIAEADSFQEAVSKKKELGVRSRKINGKWYDTCSECNEKILNGDIRIKE